MSLVEYHIIYAVLEPLEALLVVHIPLLCCIMYTNRPSPPPHSAPLSTHLEQGLYLSIRKGERLNLSLLEERISSNKYAQTTDKLTNNSTRGGGGPRDLKGIDCI